jgi:hypothetical protein
MKSKFLVVAGLGILASIASNFAFARLDNVSEKISSAVVLNNHTLVLYHRDSRVLDERKLTDETFYTLERLVYSVGAGEITRDHRFVVCLMVPPRFQPVLSVASYNRELVGFEPDTHPVLSMNNCALIDYTHPKDKLIEEDARELYDLLAVLSAELARR